ncbi:DNA polymerase I [Williamsoniiplasma somnilux]|uniref:5'-3' exonuclease n=1 Tax=Williamsoniiplasma somnilux TaxID=215578 RepID=A0A2K8NZ21_9MOLU|nr:5'-3' exonuclease [Williamsoniiplasma somnilux]ATZ19037.1 DNA polymerase I [Williamsoniiplasma somnilux]
MNTKSEKQTILIIDGYHLLHKGFYGTLKRKTVAVNRDGTYINAIYTFIAKINEVINSNLYHTIIVTFDVDQGCWRRDIYPEYKAKRKETPAELIPQFQIIREFLTSANIPWYEMPGYEGDDVMGTITKIATKLGYNIHILSNDKDTFQLVNENVKIITTTNKKEKPVFIEAHEVSEKLGCKPSQVPDVKSLLGDASDNIKGVKCLHYKQAMDLLQKYETIENIFKNLDEIPQNLKEKLIACQEQIFMNKKITKIQCNLQLGRIDFRPLKVNYYGYLNFLKKHRMWAFTGNVTKKIEEFKNKQNKKPEIKITKKTQKPKNDSRVTQQKTIN